MQKLFAAVNKWLAIMDKEALNIIMAFAVHASMPGDPLWLLIVNVPGAAKTELLRSFNGATCKGISLVYIIDSLSPNTLVSGFVNKNVKGQTSRDPSQLSLINDKLLIVKDFSEILSENYGEQKKIYADLRQAYDGYLEKSYGSGAGKRGGRAHFGLIAAATPIIDNFSVLTQQLGERFLRLRMIINPDDAVSKASEVAGHEVEMRTELNEVFKSALEDYVSNLDIDKVLGFPVPEDEIQALAKLVALLRTEVLRDRSRHVKIPPEPEIATRLVKQLKALYRMSHVIKGQGDYGMVLRVARDSVPIYRLRIVNCLNDGNPKSIDDIASACGIPRRTCVERLEDMEVIKALQAVGVPTEYQLSDRTYLLLLQGGF